MDNDYYSYTPEQMPTSRFSFFKSVSLLLVFVFLTPIALVVSVFSLVFVSSRALPVESAVLAAETKSTHAGANIFAALPDSMPSIESSIGAGDARVEIIRSYLDKYNSPMVDQAEYIVKIADENELDFRLITAIAQQESNLCKRIPEGTYNCWGWGIHSRGTLGFRSFEEGIKIVSEGIKREYINKGYTTPEEIMSKYTPMSEGSWAHGVNTFLEDME